MLLVLAKAEGVLAGEAVRGLVDLAGQPAADVGQDEADGAPEHGVGAASGAEAVAAGVDVELAADGAV